MFRLLTFLLLVLLHTTLLPTRSLAYTERYSVITDDEGNHHCRTRKVNLTNERDPFLCIYTLADRLDGKASATLTWEVSLTTNANSQEFGRNMLAVTRDLAESKESRVALSLYLSNGDRLYFDGSTMQDFTNADWHPLIHVSRENGELTAFLMFPLEQCLSDRQQLSNKAKNRYEFIMKQLQQYDIISVAFTDIYRNTHIEGEFKLARPTAETIRKMVKSNKKARKSKNKEE